MGGVNGNIEGLLLRSIRSPSYYSYSSFLSSSRPLSGGLVAVAFSKWVEIFAPSPASDESVKVAETRLKF